jgi:4-hydroxy-tetrahydrodipicolinate reductase
MVKLVIAGVAGRMGQRVLDLASQDPAVQVVAGFEEAGHPQIGHSVGRPPIKITGDPSVITQGDVLVDFTVASATLQHVKVARESHKAIVIGTTGLGDVQMKSLQEAAQDIPIVQSPNMSLGMNVLFKLVQLASRVLSRYDIEIMEAHHRFKKDAPSGSALKLGELIAQVLHKDLSKEARHGRRGQASERTPGEIGFHAIRGGDIVGDHTVLFAGRGERLELTHRAHSRDAFAAGALQAAKWVVTQKPGLYSMQDVLGL